MRGRGGARGLQPPTHTRHTPLTRLGLPKSLTRYNVHTFSFSFFLQPAIFSVAVYRAPLSFYLQGTYPRIHSKLYYTFVPASATFSTPSGNQQEQLNYSVTPPALPPAHKGELVSLTRRKINSVHPKHWRTASLRPPPSGGLSASASERV